MKVDRGVKQVRRLAVIFLLALVTLPFGGCKNALSEFADKESDQARLEAARIKMNDRDWSGAITEFEAMSSGFKAKREVVPYYASAYAGRCGLDMVNLAETLINNTSQNLFVVLLAAVSGADVEEIADCTQAENLMRGISDDPDARTSDENIFLALISFSKIGAVLARYGDLDDNSTVDASFNPCNSGELPVAMSREVGVSINVGVESLNAAGSSLDDSAISNYENACFTLDSLAPAYNFCGVYDGGDFTAEQLRAVNAVIRSTSYPGLGTCNNTIPNCICPP